MIAYRPAFHLSERCQLLTVATALLLASGLPAFSKSEDFIMDTSGVGKTNGTIVSSDQFLELGVAGPNALRLEGEQSLRMGNLDRAITVLQRSVEMAPLDMDGRILYAEALEKKLMKQHEKDPILFNFLVKQWLFVFKKSEFPDQAMQGLQHVVNLTGTQPKRMESVPKFLNRVLLPEDGSTKVALGGAHPNSEEKSDEKKNQE
ncbi:MAG: hypothetical protein C5B53_03695 [Candidatus Melainabacteria bacterium]|nr:MAG: hypothetical protein C5B53_03695 [Candidatus Melainabacteria bacterium]